MVGAIGSAASGLALGWTTGMLKWIKGLKGATLAQKAFNLVMRLNPIGLIVTAITLVGLAIYTWRDQIFGFLRGAWNSLISGLETGYNFIARLVPGMEEVSFAAKMSFEPAVEDAALAVEDLVVAATPAPAVIRETGAASATAATELKLLAGGVTVFAERLEASGKAKSQLFK